MRCCGRESPITRIPGEWADRHPVIVTITLLAALGGIMFWMVRL